MESTQPDLFEFDWKFQHLTVTIQVRLTKECFGAHVDHLELRAIRPEKHRIPITKTGYKSLWPARGEYASAEAAVEKILKWLDESSSNSEWQEFVKDSEQPSLF